jgi:ABC-2 type transport system permease protein
MPSSHFVDIAQAILFKGAGFVVVWKSIVSIFVIGVVFFLFALFMFRKSLESEL